MKKIQLYIMVLSSAMTQSVLLHGMFVKATQRLWQSATLQNRQPIHIAPYCREMLQEESQANFERKLELINYIEQVESIQKTRFDAATRYNGSLPGSYRNTTVFHRRIMRGMQGAVEKAKEARQELGLRQSPYSQRLAFPLTSLEAQKIKERTRTQKAELLKLKKNTLRELEYLKKQKASE